EHRRVYTSQSPLAVRQEQEVARLLQVPSPVSEGRTTSAAIFIFSLYNPLSPVKILGDQHAKPGCVVPYFGSYRCRTRVSRHDPRPCGGSQWGLCRRGIHFSPKRRDKSEGENRFQRIGQLPNPVSAARRLPGGSRNAGLQEA